MEATGTAVVTGASRGIGRAVAIADAILEDVAFLRSGCDPLSVAMLDGWRRQTDEAAMLPLLEAFGASWPALRC